MTPDEPIMQLRAIAKTFANGTVALQGVDLDIEQGLVHGLLGANGAGKSTLIKILSGAYGATSGEIIWRGAPVHWNSPGTKLKVAPAGPTVRMCPAHSTVPAPEPV